VCIPDADPPPPDRCVGRVFMSLSRKPLSPKQRRFVSEYLKDQNATAAAKRAGYSKKTADTQGPRLLENVGVREAIDSNLKKIEDKAIVTVEYILEGLKEVAQRCLQRVPVMEFDKAERCMVQATAIDSKGREVGLWEFDSMGANKALELLGKHIRFFPAERRELSGRDGEPLIPPAKAPDLSQITTADLVAHVKARGGAECAPHS